MCREGGNCAYMCPSSWRLQVNLKGQPLGTIHLTLERWCLSSLGTCWLGKVSSLESPKDLCVPPTLVLGLQLYTITSSFFTWALGLDSGHGAWMANTLLTKPSPKSLLDGLQLVEEHVAPLSWWLTSEKIWVAANMKLRLFIFTQLETMLISLIFRVTLEDRD